MALRWPCQTLPALAQLLLLRCSQPFRRLVLRLHDLNVTSHLVRLANLDVRVAIKRDTSITGQDLGTQTICTATDALSEKDTALNNFTRKTTLLIYV